MSVQDALSEGEVDLFDLATSSEWEDPEIKQKREEILEQHEREMNEIAHLPEPEELAKIVF